ncbi:11269_t:CDS:1, partial [Racocetra persica]
AKYRRYLIQNWLDAYEFAQISQTPPSPVNIKEAIDYCALAWNEVSDETIRNCWHKTGILLVELDNNDLPLDDYRYDEYYSDQLEVHNLIEQLPINVNDVLSASEYIKIDNELPTTAISSNQEIIAALQEDKDDESEPPIQISLNTAMESLENIRLF